MRKLPQLPRLLAVIALLLGAAGLFLYRELTIAGSLGLPLDDAWIHLTFARNFAHGGGFTFNPGEPVAGSTGPLWTMFLGGLFALAGPSLPLVKLLGLALLGGAALFLHRLARQLGAGPGGAAAAAALLVTTPRMVWASLSGMELALAVFLVLAAFAAYFHGRAGGGTASFACSGLLFALAGWARPETLVLAGGPALDLLAGLWRSPAPGAVAEPRRRQETLRALAALGSAFLAGAIPLFLLYLHLSGGASALPSTFAAKTRGLSLFDRLASGGGAGELLRQFLGLPLATLWPVVKYMLLPDNLLLVFFLPFARRAQAEKGGRRTAAFPIFVALLLLPMARAALTGETANFQQWGRYLAPLTPLYVLLGVLGVSSAFRAWGMEKPGSLPPRLFRALLAAGAVALVGLFYLLKRSLFGMGHQWPQAGSQWYLPFLGQARPVHVACFAGLALLAVLGIEFLGGKGEWPGRRRAAAEGGDGARAALLVLLLALSFNLVEDWQASTEHGWNVRNIERTQVRIGRWLAAETPPGAAVAASDIGAVGYFSGRRVIDMVGLVSPAMLELLGRFRNRDAAVVEGFRRDPPDYVVFFDSWYPGLARRHDLLDEVLRVPIENNLTCGSPGTPDMTVYRWLGGPSAVGAAAHGE